MPNKDHGQHHQQPHQSEPQYREPGRRDHDTRLQRLEQTVGEQADQLSEAAAQVRALRIQIASMNECFRLHKDFITTLRTREEQRNKLRAMLIEKGVSTSFLGAAGFILTLLFLGARQWFKGWP